MNKLFTKIAALSVGLAMAVGVGVAVASDSKVANPTNAAADTYVTMGSGSGSNNVNTWYIDSNKVTVTQNKGSSSTNPNASYVSGTNTRFYVGNVMAFVAATGYKVTGVKITNSTNSSYYGGTYHANTSWDSSTSNITADDTTNLTLTNCASTTSGQISTIESKSASGVAAIYIGTTKQSRPSKIEVKYTSSTTSYTTTVNVTGGALSVNNTSTSFTSALTSGYVYLTPDDDHVIPDNPASSFSVTNATLSSASDNQDGDVALYLTSVSGNITVSGAFDEKQGTYYSVSYTGSNGSLSSTSDVAEGDPLDVYLQPATHYHLPTSITLTMGGVTQTAGTDYDYDNGTGEIQVLEVTGNIVISTSCVEDAKYTVTYVKGDHGTGSDYVVSNQYAGSYTLATFATAGFGVDSGYAFKKWSVGGVEYAEGASITLSANTTVTAVYQEVTTYTIVTSVSNLVEDTTFVLVYETSGSYYVDTAVSNNHVALTAKTAATTISNGVASGSTLVSFEAMVLTLKGEEGAWKIKCGDQYLKFTGSSNGNDAFDTEANASTFSASIKDNKYILFTCTSATGNGRVWRMNTSYKDMRNYATNSGVGDVYMFAYIPPQNELSSIALSGEYKTSFASGDTFSFGGTVTASYTINDPANVTSSTTFHLDSANGTNMSGVTMTHAAHDGHTIYAKYTENDITKTATYSISVANAPVSSVSIGTHAAEIGLKEDYVVSGIASTVLPADAVQTTEWVAASNTVSNDFTFNGTKLTAGQTEGTVTLRCRSTADNSKYDELVVTISGDPTAAFAKDSTTGFAGKSETVSFTYGNFDAGDIAIESGNNSYVTIGTISASEGNGTVVINFVAAGSTSVTIGDGNSVLDTLTVTVSADSVTSVTWSASDIDVFSGATLSTAGWNVQYEMASGDTGSAESYTIKLGSATVTAGYEFQGADNGKTLHVEYGGVSSSSVNVVVTQTINNVNAETFSSDVSTLTFAAQCSGSGTADDGKGWTVESDGSESNFDNTKGIHYGTGKAAVQYIRLSSSDFTSGTITKVVVNASTASGVSATLAVRVGGNAFGGNAKTISSSATPYTFNGSASADDIEVEITKAESATGALYCLSIEVTYETSDGTQQIANVAAHKAAQRVAVKFANAFNTAMGTTANCTENMESAWATCSSAYNTFKSEAAALGEAEEAYAKNLIKYATLKEEWQQDYAPEDCIEKMVRVYKVCVESHGQTAFMNDLRPLQSRANIGFGVAMDNSSTSTIVIISALTGLAAIGGYFFLRKRKVQ